MLSLLETIIEQAQRQGSVPQKYPSPTGPPEAEIGNPRTTAPQEDREMTLGSQSIPPTPPVTLTDTLPVNSSSTSSIGEQQLIFTLGQIEELINKK